MLTQLRSTLDRLFESVPLFRQKLDDAGRTPADLGTLSDLGHFPFTSKSDLQAAYPFGWLAVPQDQVVRLHASSGTKGLGTLTAYTQNDLNQWAEAMSRSLTEMGLTKKDQVIITHGFGLFTGGHGVQAGVERLGALAIPLGSGQTTKLIRMIQDLKVTALVGSPSYLLHVTDEMRRQGLSGRDTQVRLLICGSEAWSEGCRRELETFFGAPAFDLYGLSEVVGPGVASERAGAQGRLTIWEDHFYPEIVEGELVLTTLKREAMPLFRYRTGDRADWSDLDRKFGFRTLERIAGRTDDAIKIKGVKAYPAQIENALMQHPAFSGRYKINVAQTGRFQSLKLTIAIPNPSAALAEEFSNLIKNHLGIRPDVELVTHLEGLPFEPKARKGVGPCPEVTSS
ncbi:MAG: phenylacetate--CoA ligase family protein [Bdellovibrionales bacterium]